MKDFIENLEDAAERQFDEMTKDVPLDHFRCYCGKVVPLSSAQPMSNNPYAMPGCPDCFDEMISNLSEPK
jgi:hypothetical protein